MQRRTFLRSFLGLIATPLLPKRVEQDEPPPDRPLYTDSEGRTGAALAALYDGDPTTGIEYQP